MQSQQSTNMTLADDQKAILRVMEYLSHAAILRNMMHKLILLLDKRYEDDSELEQLSKLFGELQKQMQGMQTQIDEICCKYQAIAQKEEHKDTAFSADRSTKIVRGLLFRSNEHTFAIKEDHVKRLYSISPDELSNFLQNISGGQVCNATQQLLPVFSLRDILEAKNVTERKQKNEHNFMEIQAEQLRFLIEVDEILDTEEIVVTPIPLKNPNIPLFSGVCFLGLGELCLVVSPAKIAIRLGIEDLNQNQPVSEDAKISTHEQHSGKLNEFLKCKFADGDSFCVPMQQIHRIENVHHTKLSKFAGKSSILHQGKVHQVLNLTELNNLEKSDLDKLPSSGQEHQKEDENDILFIVYQDSKQHVFVQIDCIEDSFFCNTFEENGFVPNKYFSGYVQKGDLSYPVLDLRKLVTEKSHIC